MKPGPGLVSRAVSIWRREGAAGIVARLNLRLRAALGLPAGPLAYRRWIVENEPGVEAVEVQRHLAATLGFRPVVQVVALGDEIAPDLTDQTYDRWRTRAPAADRAEVVVFIESGARLAPFALFETVQALEDAELAYGDCDRLLDGRRAEPFFKPAWSPELLLSTDLLGPLVGVRRELLDRAGWTEGSRWDMRELGLRLAEACPRAVHVPKVLAHRTNPPGDDAAASASLVHAHLRRRGFEAEVGVTPDGRVRARWPVHGTPLVSIIVPTRDQVHVLRRCIESITARTSFRTFELVVVDNGSTDRETLAYLEAGSASAAFRVVRFPGEFNWAAINNAAARTCGGQLLLFLNNDVEALDSDWLEELVRWARVEDVAAVGALLLRPDGTVQHAGVVLGLGGLAAHPFERMREPARGPAGEVGWYRNWLAVTGACQMWRHEVFERLGGFDEGFTALYSDIELCVRAVRSGMRVVYTPFARLLHAHGTSRGGDALMPPHDFIVAHDRLGDMVRAGDPFWNPNLSRWSAAPALRRLDEPDPGAWLDAFVRLVSEAFDPSEARRPQRLSALARRAATLAGKSRGAEAAPPGPDASRARVDR